MRVAPPRRCGVPCLALVAASLALAPVALAQDAGEVQPRAVNPGSADAPAELIRELEFPAEAADAPGDGGTRADDLDAPVATPPPDAGAPGPGAWELTAALGTSMRVSYQGAGAFPLDQTLTPATVAPFITRVRVAPELHLGPLGLLIELDAATGALFGTPEVAGNLSPSLPARAEVTARVPFPGFVALEAFGVRRLALEYRWSGGAFRVGQQTEHWGLGMLANDGARDAAAGGFGQAQLGQLLYRAQLVAHPLAALGGAWRWLETAVSADVVVRDTLADFSRGDRAFRAVLALRVVPDERRQLGLYAAWRSQRPQQVTEVGTALDALFLDVSGQAVLELPHGQGLELGFEAAGVFGSTSVGTPPGAAALPVTAWGFVTRAAWTVGKTTLFLDLGGASADQDPMDGVQQAFRFDRDFKVGLVLFDHVLAYQSARTAARLVDPGRPGGPVAGAARLGTMGSVTGALYAFPRVAFAPTDWLDLYGGPLVALTSAPGPSALSETPGRFLGLELDVGAMARYRPLKEVLLSLTAEGGLLVPGDALRLPDGAVMAPVAFGRVRAAISL